MDVDPAPKSGASSMVPIAIGLVGVVLGAVGLFTALSKGTAANDQLAALTAKVDEAKASAESAQQSAQSLTSKTMQQSQDLADLRTTMQTSLSQMITAINADREAIKAQQKILEDMTTKPAAVSNSGAGGSDTAPTTTAVPGQGGIHVVKSGDLLGNLARQYGVSLQALIDANPGINPNNIRIGSQIKIPPAKPASSSGAATR